MNIEEIKREREERLRKITEKSNKQKSSENKKISSSTSNKSNQSHKNNNRNVDDEISIRKNRNKRNQKSSNDLNYQKKCNNNKEPQKKSSKLLDFFLLLIVVIAISIACFAGYKLYSIMQEYKAGVDEYSSIAETVVKERDADVEKVKKLKNKKGKEIKKWTAPFDVDFDALKEINPDVSGWIYMEALPDISYPIVQGEDNDFYLHHTYKRESLFAGSIFMDCKNSKDFSDQNTIVYGHNMKNGSMFGTLKNYKKPETSQKSPYFWIITPKEAFKYKLIAVYTAKVNGDTYTLIKGPGKETIEYGDKMEAKSDIKFEDHEFKETDKLITLSTCTGDSSTRFVVQGVKVDPE